MTLGETISRLRTANGMSQGDLAEALNVSRQSVSKWETNGSTPDLDKLVRLSRLFQVSLDELVCGTEERPRESVERLKLETTGENTPPTPVRGIVGTVLLVVGLLGFLLILLMFGLGGLLFGLLFTLPLILCGAFCLKVRRRLGLWCAWGVYLPQQIYWTMGTSMTFWSIFVTPWYPALVVSGIMLAAVAALLVATVRSFSGLRRGPAPGTVALTAALWAVALLSRRPYSMFFLLFVAPDGQIQLPGLVTSLVRGLAAAAQTAALAGALVLTLALIRGCRSKPS